MRLILEKFLKSSVYLAVIFGFSFLGSLISVAQEPIPDPIVIIPGIGGSWNWEVMLNKEGDGEWNFLPTSKEYEDLITVLEQKGYVKDQTLFVAFYDWRKNNENSASTYLVPVIDKALLNSQSGMVDIVAHSMGGIVARSYIQGSQYRDDVDQLILLGTPNFGSSDVYSLWEGGLIPKNWEPGLKGVLGFYLWYMTMVTGETADNYDTIHQHVPSIQDLLPTYNYLVDTQTNTTKNVFAMVEKNQLLQNINDVGFFDDNLLTKRVRNVTVIAGSGENTVGDIPVIPRDANETKLWVDGVPEPNPPAKNSTEGDNRVLASSAMLPEWWGEGGIFPVQEKPRTFFAQLRHLVLPTVVAQEEESLLDQITLNTTHGSLPTTAIPTVLDALTLTPTGTEFVPPTEPDNILTFWFASPVDPVVTDNLGQKVSKDLSNIPGAFYSGENDPQGVKMIVIPNAGDGTYTVELNGVGSGGYHMGVGNFTEDDELVVTEEGAITNAQKIRYEINYNSTAEVPVEIGEPEVVEEKISAMIAALVADVRLGITESRIKEKVGKVWLVQLKIAEEAALQLEKLNGLTGNAVEWKKKLLKQVVAFQLKLFIEGVKVAEKKGMVEAATSAALISAAQGIVGKL